MPTYDTILEILYNTPEETRAAVLAAELELSDNDISAYANEQAQAPVRVVDRPSQERYSAAAEAIRRGLSRNLAATPTAPRRRRTSALQRPRSRVDGTIAFIEDDAPNEPLRLVPTGPLPWLKVESGPQGTCQRCMRTNRYIWVSGLSRLCRGCIKEANRSSR